jgi:RHS repeat-associated protein
MNYPNGTFATYAYDNNGRLTNLTHRNSTGAIIQTFSYTHDNVGNRKTKSDQNGTASYTYDPLYRLTDAINPIPSNPVEVYAYDPVGNRIDSNQNGPALFNAGNQLTEDASYTYQYDGNGNLTRRIPKGTGPITIYDYDGENRLIRVVKNGTTANYKYDPFGRRIEKAVNDSGTISVTRFAYDKEDILLELDGNIMASYTHGPGIDEPLIIEKLGFSYIYHADGLGSITDITDFDAALKQQYTYSSFGKIESQLDPNFVQPYTFTARELDWETDLYFYRERSYDHAMGRFLQQDPIRFSGRQINFYAYVNNNPVINIDPFGLAASRYQVPPEVMKNLAKDLIPELASKLPEAVGALAGVRCATDLCRKGLNRHAAYQQALSECSTILTKNKIPHGTGLGSTADIWQSCWDECDNRILAQGSKWDDLCCTRNCGKK